MNVWSQHFTASTYSGGPWGTGNYTHGDIAPEDVVLHFCRYTLLQSAKLTSIFGGPAETGGRVEVMDARNPLDLRPMPRLQMYLGAAPERREVTKSDLIDVNVQIGIRYDVGALAPLAYGQASIASVVHHIKKSLKLNDQLVFPTTNVPSGINLAERSEAGGIDYFMDIDQEERRVTATRQLSWVYHIRVNESTGKIWNLGA